MNLMSMSDYLCICRCSLKADAAPLDLADGKPSNAGLGGLALLVTGLGAAVLVWRTLQHHL